MRRLCLILIFWSVCIKGYDQNNNPGLPTPNIYHQKGDDHFDRYEFRKAIVFYNHAFKKDTSDYLALLRMAEAYSRINLPIQAEECYRLVIESGKDVDSEYLLKYALALLINKKYDQSKHWLELYNKSVEDDIRGENYLGTIENRDQLYRDSTIKIIENVSSLNSVESEINPLIYHNYILFASSRINSIDAVINKNYDIYSAEYSPFGQFLNIGSFSNYLNSSFHEGPIAISGNDSLLFCTRNIDQKDSRNKVKLGIIKTTVPSHINQHLDLTAVSIDDFRYSIGHPTVNYDGTVLYFISNASEGIGGLDIYRSNYKDGKWSDPENLGDIINTKGDEMFPYLFNDTVLYFASDGHGGLGGLDIFKVNLTKDPMKLINLGYPINSRFDDFSLFPMLEGQSGYFCSNRPGGVGSDDIYKYDILNVKVKGSLLDAENKAVLEDAKVSILTGNGEEYLISQAQNGKFEFSIIPGESYTLIIEKDDYETEEIFFSEDMTLEMRKQMLIELEPRQKTEIKLEAGQKYNFVSGSDSVDAQFQSDLESMAEENNCSDSVTGGLTVLEKQLKFSEDGVYSMQLIRDDGIVSAADNTSSTLLLFGNDTVNFTNDSLLITLPENEESYFRIHSDLDHIAETHPSGNPALNIDKGPVFNEEVTVLTTDEEDALKELEWLLSLSINTSATAKEDSTIQNITAEGFSIIPRPGYTLKVERKGLSGTTEDKLEIPLTAGVKYNFSSNPDIIPDYHNRLNALLMRREDISVKKDGAVDISLLSKELKINEGEQYAFSLLRDTSLLSADVTDDTLDTQIFLTDRIFEVRGDEKFQINVPYNMDKKVNINTDIEYLEENFREDEYNLDLDTIPFFSEILIDTTGYFKRFRSENIITLTSEEEEALREIEWMMSISINASSIEKKDTSVKSVISNGFSFIPRSRYTLVVRRKDATGNIGQQLNFSLTEGVKYNFSTDPDMMDDYRFELDSLLKSRVGLSVKENKAIDIHLLSKELEIKEGEELAFSLIPDSTFKSHDRKRRDAGSSVLLNDKVFNIQSDEKFQVNIPYTAEKKVNINTDINYLQENFKENAYKLDIDTIPFFSEILIDTTGFYKRYTAGTVSTLTSDEEEALKELEWLMSLSINVSATEEQDTTVHSVTAEGFSILPRSGYTLIVGKKDAAGSIGEELVVPLTGGIKYNFSSNLESKTEYREKLDELLKSRIDIDVKEDRAIDISLLSKELEIKEGEEFAFNLIPDSTNSTLNENPDDLGSTVFMNDRIFEIKSDEKFRINVPFTPDRKVNINTDIEYLQENFQSDEYYLDVDTIAFFSEIVIDTSGLFRRYLDPAFKNSEDRPLIPSITGKNTGSGSKIQYRVQILASRKPVTEKFLAKKYSGILKVKRFEEEDWYKYYIAQVPTYFEAKQILNDCGVKDAFIVAYRDGSKVALKDAMARQYKERMEQSGQPVTDSIVNIVTVNFDFDQFSLRPDEENYLRELVIKKLQENENTYVTINGHTDIRGSDIYNYGLSNERAEFVKSLLLKEGIDESRIKTHSYGESQLLKTCDIPDDCDESVHRVNRRVEIVLFQPHN